MEKIYQCTTNERHVYAAEPKQTLCTKCQSDMFSFVVPRVKGEKGFNEAINIWKESQNSESKETEFERLLKDANTHYNNADYDEALSCYNYALELGIDNNKVAELIKQTEFDKLLSEAELKLINNAFEEAIIIFKKALVLNVDNTKVDKLIEQAKKDLAEGSKEPIEGVIPEIDEDELGLGILLMDVSDSMNQPAFEGAKISRLEMVAKSAAYGIFGLKGMTCPEFSFLHLYKFDHEVTPFLFDNVKHLWTKYGSAQNLEKYLLEELSKRNGQTDINTALKMSYAESKQFIEGNFKLLGNYKLKQNSTVTYNDEVVTIPNVRILLYTDGLQYVNGKKEPIINPFNDAKQIDFNIMMGAFLGDASSKGCKDLKDAVGNCPIHNEKQFFLIDQPHKMKSFKNIFKMASGASGFCPACLVDEHKDLLK